MKLVLMNAFLPYLYFCISSLVCILLFLFFSSFSSSTHLSSALIFREGHNLGTILPLEHELHELLLDLLSRFAPEQLLSFLQTSQHYRMENAIQVIIAILLLFVLHLLV